MPDPARAWFAVPEAALPEAVRALLDPARPLPPGARINHLRPRWSPVEPLLAVAAAGLLVLLGELLAGLPRPLEPSQLLCGLSVLLMAVGAPWLLWRRAREIRRAEALARAGAWRFGLLETPDWVVLRQEPGRVTALPRAWLRSVRTGKPYRAQSLARPIELRWRADGEERVYRETLEPGYDQSPFL